MLEGFKNIAGEITSTIRGLLQVAQEIGHKKIVENLSEIEEKLSKNRFHLVVLGQFKRGKSTFINSLLAESVLPTAVVPLTSIVTLLKYGNEERVEVLFENGTVKKISRGELADYVTERGNPDNEKGVLHVEMAYPSGRVRHDFSERLKKSFLKFRWDLNLKVDATEEGIRSAMTKALALKKASKKEVDKETRLLAGFSNTLNRLKRELERAGESISKL